MRLLETHGCQGGAHAGYVRAGWDVTGADIDRRHARYYPGELDSLTKAQLVQVVAYLGARIIAADQRRGAA